MSNEIHKLIESKKVSDIRKGAKLLQKSFEPNLENATVTAFENQLNKSNSWETIVELIKAIGVNHYKSANTLIKEIVNRNEEYDTITIFAARSYVQLNRNTLEDISPILEVMNECKYSLGYGMLDALGYDKMMPKKDEIIVLIKRFWGFYEIREDGLSDPRYGLAAACAGWDKEIVRDFLNHCIATGDVPLKYVSENSLKGKYVKLR
ncbi:MAG: hypothetical protein Q8R57_11825 [Bacteroidota bacterium]|nr:hypothetical protein [Bacteroidota bacterium]